MAVDGGEPLSPRLKPYFCELEQGRTYLWCACGRSQNQPFCDGSHRGSTFRPVPYTARAAGEEVLFCGCKRTCERPFCDGAHNNLPGAYREDDPNSPQNRMIPTISAGDDARAMLDGGCYVFAMGRAALRERDGLRYCAVISPAQGARYQSQFYCEVSTGPSPVMGFGDRHVILLVADGSGTVTISGRTFPVGPATGVYVRPNEAFSLASQNGTPLKVFVSPCPAADEPEWPSRMPDNFDTGWPERVAVVNQEERKRMAVRFFQMLVDKSLGATTAAQFIGFIPQSKAEPHRHLYEEALIILSGTGCMWTETRKADVEAGDVIFFPSKQLHSLQCTHPDGMDVVGIIYPGDNPSINY